MTAIDEDKALDAVIQEHPELQSGELGNITAQITR
jgi:hypothetical protein